MGSDKARLGLGSATLAARAAEALSGLCAEVLIVGDAAPELPGCRRVPDAFARRCSLTGLYSALLAASAPLVLVVPCDVPFVSAKLLRRLVRAWRPGLWSVVPVGPRGQEPLVALHHRDLAQRLRARLDAGQLRIQQALDPRRTAYLPWASLRRLGVTESEFWNLNTPEDLASARRFLEETDGAPHQDGSVDHQ